VKSFSMSPPGRRRAWCGRRGRRAVVDGLGAVEENLLAVRAELHRGGHIAGGQDRADRRALAVLAVREIS